MSKELIERLKWRFQIRNAMNADRTDPITCGLHRHSKPRRRAGTYPTVAGG